MINIDYRLIYLIGTLVIAIVYFLVFLIRKDLRKIMIITSILLASTGPISETLFYKDYWYPLAFFDFKIFGMRILVEDLLFAFVAPVLGALLYFILFNIRFSNKVASFKKYIFKFYLSSIFFILLFFGITLIGKVNSIFSVAISAIINSIPILYLRRDLIRVFLITAALTGIGTFLFYYIFIAIIGKGYLYFVWLLNHDMFGFQFLGSVIPLTEVLFSATVMPFICVLIIFSAKLKIKS